MLALLMLCALLASCNRTELPDESREEISVENVEDLGLVIEAIAAASKNSVTPEYYDRTLKLQASRDDDSGRMLDIIFDSRTYDIGNIYGWGGVINVFYKTDGNYVSQFESVAGKAEAALGETMDNILD